MALPTEDDWTTYYRQTEGRAPRRLFTWVRGVYRVERGIREAVDLGCGDGTETLAMLDDGLAVTAVDGSAASVELVRRRAGARPGLTVVHARMEEVALPEADLVYSGLALPFCAAEAFGEVWARVRGAVRPHGLLAVHLFGDRHAWAADGLTCVSRAEVEALLTGLTVLDLRETDEVRPSAAGHRVRMHTFEVVARA